MKNNNWTNKTKRLDYELNAIPMFIGTGEHKVPNPVWRQVMNERLAHEHRFPRAPYCGHLK